MMKDNKGNIQNADERLNEIIKLQEKTQNFIKETNLMALEKLEISEENNDKELLIGVKHFRQFNVKQDLLEESTNFYFLQFFEMLLLHLGFFLFGPFFNIFISYKYGVNLVKNLIFWGFSDKKTLAIQYILWVTTVTTIILSYLIARDYNEKEGYFLDKQIFLSISQMSQILIIIRYLIVCVKYGFFPNEYYKRFKTDSLPGVYFDQDLGANDSRIMLFHVLAVLYVLRLFTKRLRHLS